ncbi:MAG: VWA domain-containing protein [Acidobacteriota bacterium]
MGRILSIVVPALFFVLAFASELVAQNRCLSSEDVKKAVLSVASPLPVPQPKKLKKELIAMRDEMQTLDAKIAFDIEKNQALVPESRSLAEKSMLRVCQIVRENGWLSAQIIGEDGLTALTDIVRNNGLYVEQRELLPVLTEAANKGQIKKSLIAPLVDYIRLRLGAPQIFGTQASVRDGTIYLRPLLNDAKVDEWRKAYDLPPLAIEIRNLENRYALPLLKEPLPRGSAAKGRLSDISGLGISSDENEPLKIETKIVSLNVRILTKDFKAPTELNLTKDDFSIVEDGVPQDVAFFSAREKPFDLVLILDFSGSTAEKRGLIKKAARRFVEYARPQDRVAIVAFGDDIEMVSDLNADKTAMAEKIKEIDVTGVSPIWDSVGFAYKNIIDKESRDRRSAVVLMTDGIDSSKDMTFSDLMETARHHDTTIYPVYLDLEKHSEGWFERMRKKAQLSLSMLADESGGQIYKVDDLKDLNGIYEQVVNDLGKVFSIGYEPKNDEHDGSWRNLNVTLKTQTNLIAKTRRGYYAN